MEMVKLNKKGQTGGSREQKKESVYRQLSKILDSAGVKVRREKLKQGPGWRAHSGACKTENQVLVFVDSRLILDDQVTFLVGELRERGIVVSKEVLSELPENIQRMLTTTNSDEQELAA